MILITGATGFIGHSLTREFNNKYKLLCIDNLINSDLSTIEPYIDNIVFFQDDTNNITSDKYLKFKPYITHIIHTSCSQISKSIKNPIGDLYNNTQSTVNLLEFSKTLPNLKKFIYLSSVSIFGNNPNINEHSPLDLHTPYSVSKYSGENYVKLYNKLFGVPYVILRLSNVYGYNQNPKNDRVCGVIGKFIFNIYNNLPLEVFGDGNDSRDYTFIEDVVEIIELFINNNIYDDEFNISTYDDISTNKLIEILSLYSPNLIKVNYVNKRDIDNVKNRKIDNTKIKLIKPHFEIIENGIRKIIKKEYNNEL